MSILTIEELLLDFYYNVNHVGVIELACYIVEKFDCLIAVSVSKIIQIKQILRSYKR